MDRPSEQWSENNAQSAGKPDVNLANDANHLGGIPASDFATQQYVQQFNETKQSLLLEYIDSQDLAKLQQAKDYVDTMIANQDFSIFAKLTDLQVLSETLNQKIQACKLECETEIDTKIANVVSDVNSNFSTLENAINNANSDINSLNNGMNNLFTSVSNGKSKIAAAITDKGISTASDATFDIMANNIEKIEGGGEYDENFVNTADGTITSADVALGKIGYAKGQKIYGMNTNVDTTDANATASDIKTGKTAYVNNQKITGTHEDLDTSDANATANDILQGKTAYVDGIKITGSRMETEYPTYGTDTTNATVSAEDIAFGKTAYANGAYIVGTANPISTPGIEEIYYTNNNDYIVNKANVGLGRLNETEEEILTRQNLAFSKDGKYCVSVVTLNSETYIESHKVTENGLLFMASTGENNEVIYKKYRYSYSELGLENETVLDIQFGASGLLGSRNQCLLLIKTSKVVIENETEVTKYYLHFYTYHLNENGVIGKEYEGQNYNIQSHIEDVTNISYVGELDSENDEHLGKIIFSNTNPLILFSVRTSGNTILYSRRISLSLLVNEPNIELNVYFGNEIRVASVSYGYIQIKRSKLSISYDDKFIFLKNEDKNLFGRECGTFIELSDELYPKIRGTETEYDVTRTWLAFEELGELVKIGSNNAMGIFIFYKKTSNGWSNYKSIKISDITSYKIIDALITPDNSRIILLVTLNSSEGIKYSDLYIRVYNTSDLLNASNNDTITEIQNTALVGSNNYGRSYIDGYPLSLASNTDGSIIYVYGSSFSNYNADLWSLTVGLSQNLLGIRYNNQFFRSIKAGLLTAEPSDVTNGETFIGNAGTVETGTLGS